MAAHGLPRATGDIDLWVASDAENASRVVSALRQFGAPMANISQTDFMSPGMVVQIGVTPRRIDILTAIDGVEFAEAWSERIIVALDGLQVPVLSAAHLLRNKRAAGRPKDLVDARNLEKSLRKPQT